MEHARLFDDGDVRHALAQAERAAALPYIDYPPTPWWYPAAAGAWSAAMVVALSSLGDRPAVAGPVLIALIALEGAFFGWYRRQRGVMPSLRHVPTELAVVMRRYAAGVVVVVAAIWVAHAFIGPLAAAVVAFSTVSVGLWWYERRYAVAAAATRDRVS